VKLKHYDHDGRARFVTFAVHRHLPILTTDQLRQMVLDNIDQTRQEFQLRLLGYVIMLDHVHLVVVPPPEAELGRIIGHLKRMSARDILDFLRVGDSELLEQLMVVRD
jgi:REP element-mobilizing transposase RayT